MHVFIAAAYTYDAVVLFGYYAAGYVDIRIPIAYLLLFAGHLVGVRCAIATRWNQRLSDPTLFLPVHLYAIAGQLGLIVAAPQIGFQPLATLLSISAFSFLTPDPKRVIIIWIAVAIGAAGIIFAAGPELSIPTSSFAGQALTGAVFAGLLARCVWNGMFVQNMRSRLHSKNEALKAAMARIEALVGQDEMTGLPNRRAIIATLENQMALARRANLPLTIAYIDLDHFKTINDRHGHFAGDCVLQRFAAEASNTIRETDKIGRFGGEEFLLVMADTSLAAARDPLERLRQRIATLDWSTIHEGLRVTTTIGATQYAPGDTLEELVKRADLALYHGKETGRDRVVIDELSARRFDAPRQALSA
jgi:diguanylate cyclase (GGDEF)-like protein